MFQLVTAYIRFSETKLNVLGTYVTPHHQMRHKSAIQKLMLWHNVIEENIGFKMVKE